MSRPTKYVPGPPIRSMSRFEQLMSEGRYIIGRYTGQRIHPSWAMSWQFRMIQNGIRRGAFLEALPNPEFQPITKETT